LLLKLFSKSGDVSSLRLPVHPEQDPVDFSYPANIGPEPPTQDVRYLFIVPYVAAGGDAVDPHEARCASGLGTFGQVLAGDLFREAGRVPQLLVLVLVRQSIVIVAQAGGNCRLVIKKVTGTGTIFYVLLCKRGIL
jgi:hypothetical protein